MRTFIRLSVLLALVFAFVVMPHGQATYAQGTESVNIAGTSTATCNLPGTPYDGMEVAAARQLESVDIELMDFAAPDVVSIWLTFPDGRVYDVTSALFLDGIFSFVEDLQTKFLVPGGNGTLVGYPLTETMPTGCHRLTVYSLLTGDQVISSFVLLPGGSDAVGDASIVVSPSAAAQNETIDIELSGFANNEDVALWLTQPDGTVVDLGQIAKAGPGGVLENFFLPSFLPVGQHYITAKGLSSGSIAIAPFELLPGDDTPETGDAVLVVAYDITQRSLLFVSGGGFYGNSDNNGEVVSFWLTYPDGKVLFLGDGKTATDGSFDLALAIDEQFPAGKYYVSARGNESGKVAVAWFDLAEGNGPGEVDVLTMHKMGQVAYD